MKYIKELVKLAAEGIATYNRAIRRNYENVHHIMTDEYEVLVPSDVEKYSFSKKIWNVVDTGSDVVITKKVNVLSKVRYGVCDKRDGCD